ncbi:unnamed protein product, partial [Adineta steineri]|uniref:RNI-like protein n=1 Tax=Adineta steineri TaxID=433720 RepID=A0A815SNR1_9BILA
MTRLRSINFHDNKKSELHVLLSYIPTNASYSLSIKSDAKDYRISSNLVSSLLTGYKFKKLYIHNQIEYGYKRRREELWSPQCNLTSLLIDKCEFNDYYTILQNLSYLKTLTINNMSKAYSIEYFQSRNILNSTLTSLTFDKCELPLDHIILLLSLTPELTYLKLICDSKEFDTLFDGHYWEEFIQTKLCRLKQFQFFFSNDFSNKDKWAHLDDLIAPFRRPFWLKEKHWFVACNFVLYQSIIWLYTTPIYVSNLENLLRCELSAVDNVCRLTTKPIYPKINSSSKKDISCPSGVKNIQWNGYGPYRSQMSESDGICFDETDHNNEDTVTIVDGRDHWFQIGADGMRYCCEGLQNTNTVTTIFLPDNRLGPEGAKELANILEHNQTLTIVSIPVNSIQTQGAQYLANALRNNLTVTTLALNTNHIEDEGAQYLADMLRFNKTLTYLDLYNNKISNTGAQYLADALQNNNMLKTLKLMSNKIGDKGAEYFANTLRDNTTLLTLDLRNNIMEIKGMEHLGESVKYNKTITSLVISSWPIKDEGATHIANALRENTTLTSLDLSGNKIGPDGIKDLVDALLINKTLNTLLLQANLIGTQGIEHLVNLLKNQETLTTLDLSQNEIYSNNAQQIAEALKTNSRLTTLNLSWNEIGMDGLKYLVDALKINKALERLDLTFNQIEDEDARYLLVDLQNNRTLIELNLYNNRGSVCETIAAAIRIRNDKTLTGA